MTVRSPLWFTSLLDRMRASFFLLPTVAVVLAAAAGTAMLALDESLTDVAVAAPFVLGSTVESARSVLSTIAAATVSFAGIAFSVSLLVIQRSASQHSPRIVHTLFRDPFNKRVMALVLGTFTYCLVVLRAVRGPLEEGGGAVVPNISLSVAVLLGVGAILATVAFINHSAHSMDISVVLERVTDGALEHARGTWRRSSDRAKDDPSHPSTAEAASGATTARHSTTAQFGSEDGSGAPAVLRFRRNGWVQALDLDRLSELVPPGGSLVVLSAAGRYAVQGAPLCTVTGEIRDRLEFQKEVNDAVILGNSRTMQQDASYGLRQLTDVALRALSPGVNDPTTAQDAIFHLASVVTELLRRDPPSAQRITDHGGRLVLSEEPSHDELVRTAFAELRRAAAAHPTVCVYLLEALHVVRAALAHDGLEDRAPALEEEAQLVVEGSDASGSLLHDRRLVREAYEHRFGSPG